MITKTTLVASIVLLPFAAPAQVIMEGDLKRAKPDELALGLILDDDCGESQDEFLALAESVLTQSRIKPLSASTSPDGFHLKVVVDCIERKTWFVVTANFLALSNGNLARRGSDYSVYGTLGGDPAFLKSNFRQTVEDAITDYLKVNFDLTPE
jgi:hypothetical protein